MLCLSSLSWMITIEKWNQTLIISVPEDQTDRHSLLIHTENWLLWILYFGAGEWGWHRPQTDRHPLLFILIIVVGGWRMRMISTWDAGRGWSSGRPGPLSRIECILWRLVIFKFSTKWWTHSVYCRVRQQLPRPASHRAVCQQAGGIILAKNLLKYWRFEQKIAE